MREFYFVRTVERVEIALLDVFNDMKVNKYDDITRTTYTRTVPIPVYTTVDKNFVNHWRNRTAAKIPMPIPCAGLRLSGMQRNTANVTQSTYGRNIYSQAMQKFISDLQPTPYILTYDLEFICDNRSDWGQIIENIAPYFNPYRTLRIKEFDFVPDFERKIPFALTNIQPIMEDEVTNESKHRFYRVIFTFQLQTDFYRPFELPELIKYAELNINVGDITDRQQVFMYPDSIATAQKKAWESLTPSAKTGYSLLKTVAGTLVQQMNQDGTTYWKDITIPDAQRPEKVPNFKELSFNFDFDTPNEIDQSGFGRDFVALNNTDRTYIPVLPPGSGQNAPEGYKSNTQWNEILSWFGTNNGLNQSPYTFDIILQFNDSTPVDTIFQTLHNQATDNYLDTGMTLDANEVFFEWGILSGQIYFTLRTVKYDKASASFIDALSATYTTKDKLDLNNTSIYKFVFILYNEGNDGVFGYTVDDGPMIALDTVKET